MNPVNKPLPVLNNHNVGRNAEPPNETGNEQMKREGRMDDAVTPMQKSFEEMMQFKEERQKENDFLLEQEVLKEQERGESRGQQRDEPNGGQVPGADDGVGRGDLPDSF
jgi:TolA-binding protein